MKILIANITDSGIYRNRKELIEKLLSDGHSVVIVSPCSNAVDKLIAMGCTYIEIHIQRHGMNPGEEMKVIKSYHKILKAEKPDLVFSYTIKPNLYLGILCRFMAIPYIMNITGLGEALMHEGKAKRILLRLYPIATKKAKCIFFQNTFNRDFFINHKLANPNVIRMIPGSGVNLTSFQPIDYPDEKEGIRFLFVSRIVKDKGIDELIVAIKRIKAKYKNIEFHFVGGCDEVYENLLQQWRSEGLIVYHGRVNPEEMIKFYGMMHCLIHPSYHEGMANVILESGASARPSIASDINGCKEGIDDGITGYVFEPRSVEELTKRIEMFINLSHEEKEKMGKSARLKMKREFDRQIVVNAYMDVVKDNLY